jgi:hypothetical protein
MKRLMISAFAAFAMIAAATTMLRSHTAVTDHAAGFSDAMSLQQLHSAPGVNKLPIEEYEDQSLVFSRAKP